MGCADSWFAKKESSSEAERRMLILGLDNAGKSSILYQLKENQFKRMLPTIGLNVEHISYEGYKITLWDVGGQATMLWKHYYANTDALIFVVDSSDEGRLKKAGGELRNLAKESALEECPILLFANKQDLPKVLTPEECFVKMKLESFKRERILMGCSALKNEGLWEGIGQLMHMLKQKEDKLRMLGLNKELHQGEGGEGEGEDNTEHPEVFIPARYKGNMNSESRIQTMEDSIAVEGGTSAQRAWSGLGPPPLSMDDKLNSLPREEVIDRVGEVEHRAISELSSSLDEEEMKTPPLSVLLDNSFTKTPGDDILEESGEESPGSMKSGDQDRKLSTIQEEEKGGSGELEIMQEEEQPESGVQENRSPTTPHKQEEEEEEKEGVNSQHADDGDQSPHFAPN